MCAEQRKFIIKLVFRSIRDALQITTQLLTGLEYGEIRSLYLSPRRSNDVREMIIEYEGEARIVDSLIRKATESEGCMKAVVSEFPAELVHASEGVHE
jgi:hypothetical protein